LVSVVVGVTTCMGDEAIFDILERCVRLDLSDLDSVWWPNLHQEPNLLPKVAIGLKREGSHEDVRLVRGQVTVVLRMFQVVAVGHELSQLVVYVLAVCGDVLWFR